jgi:hypothetical protein
MSSTASDRGSHRRNTAWARLRLSLVDSSRGGTSYRGHRKRKRGRMRVGRREEERLMGYMVYT